jgi:hypothetical protein
MALDKNKFNPERISTHFCDASNESEIKEIFTCLIKCYNTKNKCKCKCKKPKKRGHDREKFYKYFFDPKYDYEHIKKYGVDKRKNILKLKKKLKEKYVDVYFKFNIR